MLYRKTQPESIVDQIQSNVLSKYRGKYAKTQAEIFRKGYFPCDPDSTPEQYEENLLNFVAGRVAWRNSQKKIRFIFAWYDIWIGAYYDRKHKLLYLMIPFFGIAIKIKE